MTRRDWIEYPLALLGAALLGALIAVIENWL